MIEPCVIPGLALAALCGVILLWLVADDFYARSARFRAAWARLGVQFPHTAFSPFFKSKE